MEEVEPVRSKTPFENRKFFDEVLELDSDRRCFNCLHMLSAGFNIPKCNICKDLRGLAPDCHYDMSFPCYEVNVAQNKARDAAHALVKRLGKRKMTK